MARSMAAANRSPVTGLRRKPSKPAACANGSASASARAVTAINGDVNDWARS
jgi:hypothetical protein